MGSFQPEQASELFEDRLIVRRRGSGLPNPARCQAVHGAKTWQR
jgi:hypothetical protein